MSPYRSSEDSRERMWSQQFSERLKAARFDAAPAGLSSFKISRSSSSHTLRALRGPDVALLLLCMILQREGEREWVREKATFACLKKKTIPSRLGWCPDSGCVGVEAKINVLCSKSQWEKWAAADFLNLNASLLACFCLYSLEIRW